MTPITLQQIALAVGAAAPAEKLAVSSICTNSRQMTPDSLFVALRGEKFDGHDYLGHAAAGGARAAIVEQASPHLPCIVVPSTRRALGKLALLVRRGLGGKVIAVAGSNGKTGTKRLIDSSLRCKLRGSISPKSFNNDIGVPLTIFAAQSEDDYLVLELGTNHHGEIAPLAEMSRPDVAVITNCSAEHLEGLSDLAGVRSENAAVIGGLSPDGLLVINGDDPDLLQAVSGFRGRRVTFGFASSNDLWASDISCGRNGVKFRLNDGLRVFVPLLGRHTAANALAALAVGRELGLADAESIDGLAAATGPDMRLQLNEIAGVSVLNDAYNANPASMRAALQTMIELPAAGRRVAVLGDMRELGDWTEKYHREIGKAAAAANLDALVCVGPAAAWIGESARGAGLPEDRVTCYPDAQSACGIADRLADGDLVLLKASRSVGLELIGRRIAQARESLARESSARQSMAKAS